MANFLVDDLDFSTTEGLTSHSPQIGGSWVRFLDGTGVFINDLNSWGTEVYGGGPVAGCYNSATPASADYQIEFVLHYGGNDTGYIGVAARASTTGPVRYEFVFDNVDDTFKLRRIASDGSVAATIDTDSSVSMANGFYTCRMTVEGTTIKGFVNGVEKCSGTDSVITDAGKVGIISGGNGGGYIAVADIIAGDISVVITGTLTATESGSDTVSIQGGSITPGVITTLPLKNNTGTLLANETGATAYVYLASDGTLIATKTAQTTNASGVMTVSDVTIAAGTGYRLVIVLASGAEGMDRITAA